VIPWVWYDSATYTSTTTTSLDFFSTVQTDKVIGNMEAAGQIPAPMYFQIFHLGIYPLIEPLAVNIGDGTMLQLGASNDMFNLLAGNADLQIAQKSYWNAPIFLCPPGAGVEAAVTAMGTYTAESSSTFEVATNGVADLRNRNNFWGMIVIPHNQNFRLRCTWSAALTLAAGNSVIRAYLDGYLYRRVL
jgi:hypothetical protein